MLGLERAIIEGNLEIIHLFDRLEIGTLVTEDIFKILAQCETPNKFDVIVRVMDILAMKEGMGPYESPETMFDQGTYLSQFHDWTYDITKLYRERLSREAFSSKQPISKLDDIWQTARKFDLQLRNHHEAASRALVHISMEEHE